VQPLVLLVDDAEDVRELYSESFSNAGFQVDHAVDGEHALLKMGSRMPDVVVMDLAMPVLDGWEATRRIKAHARTRHIPVIALTGDGSEAGLQRAEDAGADVVVTKPCTPQALIVMVHRLLDE